jgi:hypothetical protein
MERASDRELAGKLRRPPASGQFRCTKPDILSNLKKMNKTLLYKFQAINIINILIIIFTSKISRKLIDFAG